MTMPFDLPAEHVLPLLKARGGWWASNAEVAWQSLTASGDAPVVTLHDLEHFLWYALPTKFLMSPDDHRAIARALGEMLVELGYEAAGELCRGPVTMGVIAAWEHGSSSGQRALTKALDNSGVEPPDTDSLEWGGLMGATESGVYDAGAEALEEALSRGEFRPGERGWKQAQAEVIRRFLLTPRHALDERTPQTAVWDERQESWAEPPLRPLRKAFLEPVRELIRRPPAAPDGIGDRMRPLFRLLELTATGLPLTGAGYLSPGTAWALAREFGWWPLQKPPRSEVEVPRLLGLREFVRQAGLLRKGRGRLGLTETGRRALADHDLVWRRVVAHAQRGRGLLRRDPRARPRAAAPGIPRPRRPGRRHPAGSHRAWVEAQRRPRADAGHGVLQPLGGDPAAGPARHRARGRLAGPQPEPHRLRRSRSTCHPVGSCHRTPTFPLVIGPRGADLTACRQLRVERNASLVLDLSCRRAPDVVGAAWRASRLRGEVWMGWGRGSDDRRTSS